MVDKERRSTSRTSVQVKVEVEGQAGLETVTRNVARNGVFLDGELPQKKDSPVRLKLTLPPDGFVIEILGRVAWKGIRQDRPGTGIHFLQLGSTERERWLEFVNQVELLDKGSTTPPAAISERRQAPRTESSFLVRFKSKESMEEFVTSNLSAGGMFLATPVLKPVGASLQVVIVHPETGQDFELAAEVIRTNSEPNEEEGKGMALKFIALSERRADDLKAFLES